MHQILVHNPQGIVHVNPMNISQFWARQWLVIKAITLINDNQFADI